MNTEDIIRMAREAGFHEWYWTPEREYHFGCTQKFATLATAKEREARRAAQIENEQLKARLARADLEQQRAVMAEREACAKVAERHGAHPQLNVAFGGPDWYKHGKSIAAAIRARSQS